MKLVNHIVHTEIFEIKEIMIPNISDVARFQILEKAPNTQPLKSIVNSVNEIITPYQNI